MGELIAKGRTAEVYKWQADQVVKLYLDQYQDWLDYEYKVSSEIHASGVLSPRVVDTASIGTRRGIIFNRLSGDNLLLHIQKNGYDIENLAKEMARTQFSFHQYVCPSLPNQPTRFQANIEKSKQKLGSRRFFIVMEQLKLRPTGNRVCHGDYFPGNIVATNAGLVTIDWISAYSGNAASDVARTCLIFMSPDPLPNETAELRSAFNHSKSELLKFYLAEYIKISDQSLLDIDGWMLPVLASRIWEQVEGEEDWLISEIDKRICLIS